MGFDSNVAHLKSRQNITRMKAETVLAEIAKLGWTLDPETETVGEGPVALGTLRIRGGRCYYCPQFSGNIRKEVTAARDLIPWWYTGRKLDDIWRDYLAKKAEYTRTYPRLSAVRPLEIILTISSTLYSPSNLKQCAESENNLAAYDLVRETLPLPIFEEMYFGATNPEHPIYGAFRARNDLSIQYDRHDNDKVCPRIVSDMFGIIANHTKDTFHTMTDSFVAIDTLDMRQVVECCLPRWYCCWLTGRPACISYFELFCVELLPIIEHEYEMAYPALSARWKIDIHEYSDSFTIRIAHLIINIYSFIDIIRGKITNADDTKYDYALDNDIDEDILLYDNGDDADLDKEDLDALEKYYAEKKP